MEHLKKRDRKKERKREKYEVEKKRASFRFFSPSSGANSGAKKPFLPSGVGNKRKEGEKTFKTHLRRVDIFESAKQLVHRVSAVHVEQDARPKGRVQVSFHRVEDEIHVSVVLRPHDVSEPVVVVEFLSFFGAKKVSFFIFFLSVSFSRKGGTSSLPDDVGVVVQFLKEHYFPGIVFFVREGREGECRG